MNMKVKGLTRCKARGLSTPSVLSSYLSLILTLTLTLSVSLTLSLTLILTRTRTLTLTLTLTFISGLHTLATVVVSYRGRRLVAQSIIPGGGEG